MSLGEPLVRGGWYQPKFCTLRHGGEEEVNAWCREHTPAWAAGTRLGRQHVGWPCSAAGTSRAAGNLIWLRKGQRCYKGAWDQPGQEERLTSSPRRPHCG